MKEQLLTNFPPSQRVNILFVTIKKYNSLKARVIIVLRRKMSMVLFAQGILLTYSLHALETKPMS